MESLPNNTTINALPIAVGSPSPKSRPSLSQADSTAAEIAQPIFKEKAVPTPPPPRLETEHKITSSVPQNAQSLGSKIWKAIVSFFTFGFLKSKEAEPNFSSMHSLPQSAPLVLGDSFASQGDLFRAAEKYQEAAQKSTSLENAILLYQRAADCYREVGRSGKALNVLQDAAVRCKGDGDFAHAALFFDEAAEIAPSDIASTPDQGFEKVDVQSEERTFMQEMAAECRQMGGIPSPQIPFTRPSTVTESERDVHKKFEKEMLAAQATEAGRAQKTGASELKKARSSETLAKRFCEQGQKGAAADAYVEAAHHYREAAKALDATFDSREANDARLKAQDHTDAAMRLYKESANALFEGGNAKEAAPLYMKLADLKTPPASSASFLEEIGDQYEFTDPGYPLEAASFFERAASIYEAHPELPKAAEQMQGLRGRATALR